MRPDPVSPTVPAYSGALPAVGRRSKRPRRLPLRHAAGRAGGFVLLQGGDEDHGAGAGCVAGALFVGHRSTKDRRARLIPRPPPVGVLMGAPR